MRLPSVPRSAIGSLAGLVPSLLSGLGVPGFGEAACRGLLPAGTRGVCLLLVDGLGWRLLREHEDAPFLASLAENAEPIAAGFPATTAASIATLGTGLPVGVHGIVGYSFAIGDGLVLEALGWSVREDDRTVDVRSRFVPEEVQPLPTALERAAAAGARVRLAVSHHLRDSGLSRAVLRGGDVHGVYALGDLTAAALAGLSGGTPALTYAYHGDLGGRICLNACRPPGRRVLVVADDTLTGVRLASGEVVALDTVVLAPRFTARAGVLASLGLKPVDVETGGHIVGSRVPADSTGATAVPGV